MFKHAVLCLFILAFFAPELQSAEAVPGVTAADPSCACVAQGRRWAQGDQVCIAGQTMICGMNQNISTWKNLGLSCQVSSVNTAKISFTAM